MEKISGNKTSLSDVSQKSFKLKENKKWKLKTSLFITDPVFVFSISLGDSPDKAEALNKLNWIEKWNWLGKSYSHLIKRDWCSCSVL